MLFAVRDFIGVRKERKMKYHMVLWGNLARLLRTRCSPR